MKIKKTFCLLSLAFLGFVTSQIIASAYSETIIPTDIISKNQPERLIFPTKLKQQVLNKQDKLCLRCHKELRELMTVDGHEVVHCTDCHVSLKEHKRYKFHERPQPSAIPACLECHKNYDTEHNLMHNQFDPAVTQNPKERKNDEPLPTCTDCHDHHRTDLSNNFSPILTESKINKCVDCHLDEYKEFTASNHYNAILEKSSIAPDCLTCHEVHKTSDVDKVELCLSCHLDSKKFPDKNKRLFVTGYFTEFHGRIAFSNMKSAEKQDTLVCSNCHGEHAASTMHAKNFTGCGNEECHNGVSTDFIDAVNIHGRSNIKATTNFAAWLVQLLGKIFLFSCLFITLIDNILSTLRN